MTRLRELLEHDALKGVAIGACVAGDEWEGSDRARNREIAHAHFAGSRKGWVCVRRLKHYNRTTLIHEIAHLVRGRTRHDDAWRREVRALGGQVEPSYRKRTSR